MAGTRPTSPTRFADVSSVNRTAIDPSLRDVGFASGAIIPAGENNQRDYEVGEWLTYLSDLSPASDVLDFRVWQCPDDASFTVEWDGPSGTDGLLTATVDSVEITLPSSGFMSLTTSALGIDTGVFAYRFLYDAGLGVFFFGSPPELLDIYAPAACEVLTLSGSMTISKEIDGNVILQTTSPGAAAEAAIFLGYHGGAKGSSAAAGVTDCYLRSVSIVVIGHAESGGGSPDTDVSLQSMAPNGTWTTHATANLTTTIVATVTTIPIPVITSGTTSEIPRGAPLRIFVEHAAISGQIQQIEILSASLTYIRTAVD